MDDPETQAPKHNTETYKDDHNGPTKNNWWWIKVLAKAKQFLFCITPAMLQTSLVATIKQQ
jgi:hypothetical protein